MRHRIEDVDNDPEYGGLFIVHGDYDGQSGPFRLLARIFRRLQAHFEAM
jgi:hypothetical protein